MPEEPSFRRGMNLDATSSLMSVREKHISILRCSHTEYTTDSLNSIVLLRAEAASQTNVKQIMVLFTCSTSSQAAAILPARRLGFEGPARTRQGHGASAHLSVGEEKEVVLSRCG